MPEIHIHVNYFVTNFDESLFKEYWDSVSNDWGLNTGLSKIVRTSVRILPEEADIVIKPEEISFKNGFFEVNPALTGSPLYYFNNFDKLNNQLEIELCRMSNETQTTLQAPEKFRKWFITWDRNGRQIAAYIKRISKEKTYLCWRVIKKNEEDATE